MTITPSTRSRRAKRRSAARRWSSVSMLKSVRSYALRPTTSSMPRRRSTTDGLVKNGAITPSVWVRPSDRLRAVALGR